MLETCTAWWLHKVTGEVLCEHFWGLLTLQTMSHSRSPTEVLVSVSCHSFYHLLNWTYLTGHHHHLAQDFPCALYDKLIFDPFELLWCFPVMTHLVLVQFKMCSKELLFTTVLSLAYYYPTWDTGLFFVIKYLFDHGIIIIFFFFF